MRMLTIASALVNASRDADHGKQIFGQRSRRELGYRAQNPIGIV
jgi:hypothetical protein